MGDEDEGRAELLMQPLHFVLHAAAQVLVERRERLVEQEDGRLEDERARKRHALLLAARQFRRQLAFVAGETDALDDLADAALSDVARRLPHLEREGDVLRHRHMRKERVALEHHAEGARLGASLSDVLALAHQAPDGRLLEAGHDHEKGRLAGAGGAEQGQKFAAADIERHTFERLERPEGLSDADRLKADRPYAHAIYAPLPDQVRLSPADAGDN